MDIIPKKKKKIGHTLLQSLTALLREYTNFSTQIMNYPQASQPSQELQQHTTKDIKTNYKRKQNQNVKERYWITLQFTAGDIGMVVVGFSCMAVNDNSGGGIGKWLKLR